MIGMTGGAPLLMYWSSTPQLFGEDFNINMENINLIKTILSFVQLWPEDTWMLKGRQQIMEYNRSPLKTNHNCESMDQFWGGEKAKLTSHLTNMVHERTAASQVTKAMIENLSDTASSRVNCCTHMMRKNNLTLKQMLHSELTKGKWQKPQLHGWNSVNWKMDCGQWPRHRMQHITASHLLFYTQMQNVNQMRWDWHQSWWANWLMKDCSECKHRSLKENKISARTLRLIPKRNNQMFPIAMAWIYSNKGTSLSQASMDLPFLDAKWLLDKCEHSLTRFRRFHHLTTNEILFYHTQIFSKLSFVIHENKSQSNVNTTQNWLEGWQTICITTDNC